MGCVYPMYAEYMAYVIDRLLLNWNKVNAGQFSCRLCTCCRPQPMWSSCSISPARDLLPVKNCLFMKLLETIDYVIMLSCELTLPKGIKLRVLEKQDWCLICARLELMPKHGWQVFNFQDLQDVALLLFLNIQDMQIHLQGFHNSICQKYLFVISIISIMLCQFKKDSQDNKQVRTMQWCNVLDINVTERRWLSVLHSRTCDHLSIQNY